MEFLNKWWGINEDIDVLDIAARAVVMFIIIAVIICVTGMRSFRKNNPFDIVIVFLVGGIISRGVVGATPFIPSVVGAVAVIILQKIFSKLSLYSRWFEVASKGERLSIYKNGSFIRNNMKKADVTKTEVYEDMRVQCQTESLDRFEEIYVEKSGEISFVKKGKVM